MTERLGSGGPWEERYGYARAVATGPHLWVSGCTAVVDGQVVHEGDASAQTQAAFTMAFAAMEQAGFDRADVVRTRMFVVDLPTHADAVGRAHGALFGEVRPATSMLGTAALLDPRMLVEVEIECYRAGR